MLVNNSTQHLNATNTTNLAIGNETTSNINPIVEKTTPLATHIAAVPSATNNTSFTHQVNQGNLHVISSNNSNLNIDERKTLLTYAIREYNVALHFKDNVPQQELVDTTEKLINSYIQLMQLDILDKSQIDKTKLLIALESYKFLKSQCPEAACLPVLNKKLLAIEIHMEVCKRFFKAEM